MMSYRPSPFQIDARPSFTFSASSCAGKKDSGGRARRPRPGLPADAKGRGVAPGEGAARAGASNPSA